MDCRLTAASYFLVDIGETSVEEQLKILEESSEYLYNPAGVTIWQPFENWPVKDILNEIESLQNILQEVYDRGRKDGKTPS